MAILTFSAAAVAAQIAHARSCSTFLPNRDGPVGTPALILIVGQGVHIRSNGIDGTTTRIVTTRHTAPEFAYAIGINPFETQDWKQAQQAAFRDLTGQFYTDLLNDIETFIDRGDDVIHLSTDGYSVKLFASTPSDYLIGGIYTVPSGLGGRFRVQLKDIDGTTAIVKNLGNCEDFDAMLPYRVPLDHLMEMQDRKAA